MVQGCFREKDLFKAEHFSLDEVSLPGAIPQLWAALPALLTTGSIPEVSISCCHQASSGTPGARDRPHSSQYPPQAAGALCRCHLDPSGTA